MSYDVGFEIGGERVCMDRRLDLRGGTYAFGGTSEAWLNITYNYGGVFRQAFEDPKGIRSLYGKSAKDCREVIALAKKRLASYVIKVDEVRCDCHKSLTCYWAITRANVLSCLDNLLTLANNVPDEATFQGD